LLDRLITIQLGHYDRETEIAITARKSGVAESEAERVVDLVRLCRAEGRDPHHPTIRAAIAIARVLACRGCKASFDDPVYVWACRDILGASMPQVVPQDAFSLVDSLIRHAEDGVDGALDGEVRVLSQDGDPPSPHHVGGG
jgi:hypothetical protein